MAPVLPPNTRPTSPLAPTPRFWRPPPASILRQASDRVDALHVSGHPSSVAVEAVGELRLPWTRAAYALTWRGLTALVSLAVALFAAHASLLAVAIIPMAARYGWDPASQGVLLSASYSGQLCSQLAGGLLADRWGGRAPLAAGVVASSLASLLTPVATAGGRGGLVVVRVLLGLAQGAATPAVHSLLSAHCPPARQTTAAAAVAAATLFGTALSDDGLSEAGTDWSDGVATAHKARLAALPSGFAALLRQREVWAICVAQFAGSWGAYGLLSWLPSFFRDAYGVELARLGRFAVLPYAHAGLVWGAGSSAATAAGLLAVPVSGVVLEATGSWAAVFGLAAAIYALGAGLYWVWAGGEALLADG
ncbi:putative anion transporter 4, chloroplastic [Auxenochlorella protothecoides]|uniref:Putative anion transporter 4, chloroplastic n=1 Tax=Auxenochlorella protothecoides TaxID=3075 RepID=A0A087SSQ3_AUXPR|nr:putative anion transporter 4, chloroplastic [Auxenochlorella protothecoides]KFM28757.1 putative anion transporter 4, chloroplastic [Auxenochlorella protothecoides]